MSSPRPSLLDLLTHGLTAARPEKPLFGRPYYRLSQAAMVGAYLYMQGAVLGVRFSASPDAIASLIWDSARLDILWTFASAAIRVRDERTESRDIGVRTYFLSTEFPALYSTAGMRTSLEDLRSVEKIAGSKLPADETYANFARWLAEAVAFGLMEPDRVDQMLGRDFAPVDPESWRQWYEAGLDISEEPAEMDRGQMTADLVVAVQALATEYYPQLVQYLA